MSQLFIGAMSGTSLDGIDIALTEINRGSDLEVLAFRTYPFEPEFRNALHDLVRREQIAPKDLVAAHHVFGLRLGETVEEFLRANKTSAADIQALGMHGVTLFHLPEKISALGAAGRGTLQLGDPHVVHAQTGIQVIFDFRHADMALGGQGAPLAPFFDHLLFHHPQKGRVLLNLGGIANLTFLLPGVDEIFAFDTGPANMVIDALMRIHPTHPQPFDPDGRYAARGKVRSSILANCLCHPYFQVPPPKSTGRELFGHHFVNEYFLRGPRPPHEDLIATATMLTAVTVADAIRARHNQADLRQIDEVIVSGGGARNGTLMDYLRRQLPDIAMADTRQYGLDPDAKEAALMALLAWAHLHRVPANFPAVTGASRATVLGVSTPT